MYENGDVERMSLAIFLVAAKDVREAGEGKMLELRDLSVQ